MGASEQNQSNDDQVRKLVVPPIDIDPTQDDSDSDRSPTDEETKRDAPEQISDLPSDEVVRKLIVPVGDGDSSQDYPDRSPTDEETKRDAPVGPLPDDGDESEEVRKPVVPDAS